jgi:DNA-binding LytR/AlgR family response regulator
MSFSALVVDDEPYARAHLRSMLESADVSIAGEADNVASALQLVEDLHPAVVFLDVQMPGLSGVHMARAMAQMPQPPLIVFVTGFSDYALEAFEYGAIDYLVKPLSEERLAGTLQRIRARVDQTSPANPATQPELPIEGRAEPITRLPVRIDYAVRLLRVDDIVAASAREKRVFVLTADGVESRTYYTLTQLEQMLPPDRFARIHDSYIVSLDSVSELVYLGSHAYEVKLTNGSMLPVGRRRFADLKRRLGMSGG